MRTYAQITLMTNSGSSVVISTREPTMTFDRMFISYQAQRIGFRNGCRPFIGIDGTWLKSPFKGCLLTTVGLDANEGESDASWEWFLVNLKEFLDLPPTKPICIISDHGKSILKKVPTVWLQKHHTDNF